MSKKIKNEQKKFLGETLNQYDKALSEGIEQLDKKNREQNHKISSLVNSFDNEYLEKDVEGNMTTLENSKDGMVIINEIQGSTEVNYCKDGEKELILNGDIDTQGESFVTLTEGVDGGLVDVSLEGNTEINLSKTKDPVLVTREFDDINCNVGKLQYTIDDVTTINDEPGKVDIDRIVGDTMVNHAVNGSEELILNAHIDESGDNNIKLNGVTSDGGKVDVFLEGNTLVNVSNVKDDYITPSIEDKVDQGSVISLPEVSAGYVNIDSIEGNTLVNYCTDGAKELTLNGDINVEGTFVTTTEGVDNGLVDVMCEGNTLVNVVKEYSYGFTNASRVDSQYVKLQHGTDENSCNITMPFGSCLYKPSTTYTLVVDIKENTSTARLGISALGSVISSFSSLNISREPGRHLITFTTKDDFTTDNRGTNAPVNDIYFCSWDKGGDGSNHIIFRFYILEGDWTGKEIPQYFEGMKSVGQDEVNGHKVEVISQNKNLFDGELEIGTLSNTSDETMGKPVEDPTYIRSKNYIRVEPNTAYILKVFDLDVRGMVIHQYDNEGKNILYDAVSQTRFTTLSNCHFIKFRSFQGDSSVVLDNFDNLKIQLEKGTSLTDYTIPKSNKKEIPLNEPLRSLPNGVKDRFVKIGGKWFIERNCAEVILNGGESWSDSTSVTNESNLICWYNLPNGKVSTYTNSDRFSVTYKNGGANIDWSKESIFSGNAISGQPGRIALSISKSKLVSSDIQGFKTWLANNPTRVVYELATPTYEPLETEPTLNTYNEVTHLSNNSIIPCNMQIKNTGYNCILKPSTLYTVALDTNKAGTIGMSLGGAKVTTTNNVATITTPATLTDDSLRLYGKGIKGSKIRLLEGDKTNWIPSHFEGMKSSFEDKLQEDGTYKMEILMNNKNLLDLTDIVHKGIGAGCKLDACSTELIQYTSNQEEWTQIFFMMKLKPFTRYTLSAELQSMNVYVFNDRVGTWDTGKYIGVMQNTTNTLQKKQFSFTTNKTGCISIRFTNERMLGVNIAKNIILSEVVGDYTSKKSNKIQFSSIEPLRGVGDAHDRLVFKDGKLMIERNCGEVVLNGGVTGEVYADGNNYTQFNINFDKHNTNSWYLLNKDFVNVRFTNSINSEAIALHYQKLIVLKLNNNKATTMSELNEWLKDNPIVGVYQLAEPTYEEIPYDLQKIILESYDNGTLFFDTNIPPTKVSFNCFEEELTYLYPATSYTVQFTSDRAITADVKLGGTSLLAQSIVQGLNRITMTTPSELVDNKLVIDGAGAKISEVVVTDTNREFKYFEGMKSVGEGEDLEVKSGNKNLFDINNVIIPIGSECVSISNNIVNYSSIGNVHIRFKTHIKPNTNYICSFIKSEGILASLRIRNGSTYLIIGEVNSGVPWNSGSYEGEGYFEIFISINSTSTGTISNIQIEEGSVATDYITHQSNTQQLTHEPLRSIGDAKDRYVLIDGKWYIERNCAQIIIDENSAIYNNNNTQYWIPMKNAKKYINCKCNILARCYIDWQGNLIINTQPFDSISLLKTWLADNPLDIIYQLASPVYQPIDYNPLEVYADITHISTNSIIPTNITIKNHGYNLVALKENTQYTLYVNKDTTNALTYRLGDYIEINSPSKFTFTTPETLTDKTLRIDGKGAKVNDLMLIEGTPTNDSIGYFDGLKSSYECEQVTDENDVNYGKYKVDVKVVGKNLFDGETRNGYYSSGVFKANANNLANVNPIRIKPNTSYVGSGDASPRMSFYDKDMNFILNSTSTCNISPSNACYMNIHAYGATWFQIEEGDTATEYEPYFESKQTIYLNSPLLKGDEIVWKDNKIQHYHKMKTVVLDSSDDENWSLASISTQKTNVNVFDCNVDDSSIINDAKISTFSDKLPSYSASYLFNTVDIEGIGQPSRRIRICLSKSKASTIEGFKQWLQQNPLTVVYELETPYYEEISDYPLKLNVIANSSLSTESTIQVTNISFNVYEETLPYLYPNTKYYITFNSDVDRNNIVIDLGGNHVVFDCKVGFNKVEITTPNDTTNLLTFSGTGVNIDHVKVTQQDIDEYFEGMKSVGECEGNRIEILSRNKNLIDINRFKVNSNRGTMSIDGNVLTFNYTGSYPTIRHVFTQKEIDLLKGKTFKFGHGGITDTVENNDLNIRFVARVNGRDQYYVFFLSNTNYTHTVTLANNIDSLEFSIVPNNTSSNIQGTFTIREMQLLFADTENTNYIPHQSNIQQLTHEPLRGVEEVRDRYAIIDGKWYIERKYKEVVLDGSDDEGWRLFEQFVASDGNTNESLTAYCTSSLVKDDNGWNLTSVCCDKLCAFKSMHHVFWRYKRGISVGDKQIILTCYKNSLSEFKQWLQQNPLTLIYQTASPIYEEIDYNPFETYADITHITTNSLIPTNVVVKNHGYNCILKPSTTYTVALNKPNGTISAKLGGSAKVDSTNSIFTITTPSTLNDNVLRLSGSGKVKDIMILEGDKTVNTPSYFEGIESVFEQEYDAEVGKYRVTARVKGNGKESSIIFYINEPLRGTGTAKDKVYIKDGKVVVERKCKGVMLDVTGGSLLNDMETEDTIVIGIWDYTDKKYNGNHINDTFKVTDNRNNTAEYIYSDPWTSSFFMRIKKSRLTENTLQGVNSWLQQNPVTVVYELAEPVYEEADCDLSKLVLENYENSSLIFESNIPVSANIKYSGEVPVVTQAKALSSQVDNTTLDINENIIPYMCDIDYRIVELQLMNGDTQGEGIELLGIGDIEILGNENVLFNNREDKKHNYSYDMLKRDILSQRYSKEEYQYRLDRYLLANKISDEEYKELEGLLNNGE